MEFYENYLFQCAKAGLSPSKAANMIGLSSAAVNGWKKGKTPNDVTLKKLAILFKCSIEDLKQKSPNVTDSFVSFPIIGDVAAGYEHFAFEDYTNGELDIPVSWLKGRSKEDYFVLRITGDSMYPTYQDGDLILVLRQNTADHSGQICVAEYEDDKATLKRVEFGSGWVRLSPVNPQYPPVLIKGEDLEHFRVLGLPKVLIRNVL